MLRPESGNRGGHDALLKLVDAWTRVQHHASHEPCTEPVTEPDEVPCRATSGSARNANASLGLSRWTTEAAKNKQQSLPLIRNA